MTQREKDVVALWRKGRVSDEIASILGLTMATVKAILYDLSPIIGGRQ